MSDDKHQRGFTTAILHSDRDAADRARRAAQAAAPVGRLRLPRRARARGRVPGPRDRAMSYGRQGNPTSAALEAKVNAMEDGVGTVASPPAWRRSARSCSRCSRPATTSSRASSSSATRTARCSTLESHGHPVSFVDATDVRNVEAALTPATRIVFVETIANPRTQVADLEEDRRAVPRARPPLHRRQHDDVAVAVPAEARRRGPHRQRADQVHRRPRQRARGQHHRYRPVRLDDVSRTSRTPTRRSRRTCGACSSCARRACATGAARWPRSRRITSPSARRRWRCAWSGICANAQALARVAAGPAAGARRPLPRTCRPSAARARRGTVPRLTAACFRSSLRDGIDPFEFLNRLARRRAVVEPRRQPHARDSRSRTRSSGRWAPSGARAWASPIR